MKNLKKWMTVSAIAVPVILAAVVVSQPTFAEQATNGMSEKLDKLQKLKVLQDEEKKKFESMSGANTQEEIDRALEQGLKVKGIGIEIGELEEEINPKDGRVVVQERIQTLKRVFGTKYYYRDLANDPRYKKAFEILQQKERMLAELEQDFIKNKKSVDQVNKELDAITAIKELE